MTSQLCQNFQVRQVLHGSMTSHLWIFRARSILLGFVVPKLILLFTWQDWSAQQYSINFERYWFSFETICIYARLLSDIKVVILGASGTNQSQLEWKKLIWKIWNWLKLYFFHYRSHKRSWSFSFELDQFFSELIVGGDFFLHQLILEILFRLAH